MSRRTRTTAILLVLLLALVVVAPALPFVRDAIVTRVLGSLGGSGVSVTYRANSGNAWRSITLHDVEARGLGADVNLERLTIGYFLPSLLGGELPIDVLVSGATGDVDVKQLLDASMGDASGGAAGPISLRLRKIDLQDIGVSLAQVPFTLPDANIGSLSVTQDGTALDLGAVVSTADGEATVEGRYDALTSVFTGRVTQADATIARHWWDGVTAGNLTGTLTIRGSSIDGDFVLVGGAVDDLGLVATDVSGDVTVRYPVITAELDGNAFGGRVAATGVVNITAERWEANGGGIADLGRAADWLARSLLPDGVPLPMTGTVDVDLSVVGWEEIDLEGTATGSGTLADMPIEGLRAAFAVAEDGTLSVDASGLIGGGPLALTIGADARGERIVASATDVALAIDGNDLGVLNATLDMAADGPQNGSLLASWQSDLAGRAVTAQLDAELDPDGWQAFVTGSDDLGTSLEGALVLADGELQGGLTAVDVAGLPLSPGARLAVAASGPVSAPTLTVTLAADEPVTLAVGPPELQLIDDLRGSLTGTVAGTTVPDLRGAFGPIGVSGTLYLSPIAADLALTLEESTFAYADTASATVGITGSALRIDADGAAWNGTITTPGVALGPLVAATGPLNVSASFGGAATADGVAQPWSLTVTGADGTLAATVDPVGVTIDLDDLTLTGSVPDLPLAARLSGTVTSLAAERDGGAGFGALAVDATVPAGSTFGPTRLVDDLALSGVVDLAEAVATLEGGTGPVGLDLTAAFGSGSDATVGATVSSGATAPLGLSFDVASGRFALTGAADPIMLLAALDLAPAGSLVASATADLSGTLTGPGLADLDGAIELGMTEPLALSAQLTGAGTSLAVAVEGGTAEFPLTAAGTLDLSDLADVSRALGDGAAGSAAGLSVSVGPLDGIVVTTSGATGAGVFEVGALGPLHVEPIPWALTADWTDVADPYATITSGDSAFTLILADGQPLLDGSASLPIEYAGESLRLSLAVGADGAGVPVNDLAALPLLGSVEHEDTGATLLTVQGTVGALLVSGDLPTALLAAPLPVPVSGQVRDSDALHVDAEVNLLAGPDYTASLALTAAGTSFTGSVSGAGGDIDAELTGEDLQLRYDGDTLSVTADDASLAPFLGGGGSGLVGTVDGTLAYDPATGWRGTLATALDLRLAGVSDAVDLQAGSADVTATAMLQGRGDTLELVATGIGPASSRLTASGSLAPDVAVSADVTALDGVVTAVLGYTTDSGLTGALSTTSFDVDGYAHVPSQRADLDWRPGAPLRLTGPGIDVSADVSDPDAPVSGSLDLLFTLLDGPARIAAEVGGSLTAPSASLEVVGTGLHAVGTGTLSAADATLTIDEPAIARLLPDLTGQVGGLVASPVTADAHWTAGDGWTLAATSLVGPADPDRVDNGGAALSLDLAGSGAEYSGALAVSLGGDGVASVSIAGVGADLTAGLDLALVEWETIARRFGVDASIVGGGQARLTTAPLAATLDVDMSGTLAWLAVTLQGSAPNDLSFTVSGVADAGGTVDLSGRLAWDQEQKAVVTGSIGGQSVDASLTLDDALSSGRLLVDVPGAQVVADLTTTSVTGSAAGPGGGASATTAARRVVDVTAALDGSAFGGLAGDLSASITNEDGVTTLDSLRADAIALPGLGDALPLTLTASGVLAPAPEVNGTVTAPTLDETATLRVSGQPGVQVGEEQASAAAAGTTVELAWRDLRAVFDTASSRVHLTGEAALGDVAAPFLPDALAGLSADVTGSDLTWSPDEGFGGTFEVALDAAVLEGTGIARPVRLRAGAVVSSASAPADLGVQLDVATSGGTRLATLDLTVPADPLGASSLSGDLQLDTDVADLLALPQLELRLTGSAAITGTFTDPTLAGTLELVGDVTAEGEFGYRAGAASLDLSGPELSVSADYADAGWSADATVDRLPLAAWLTQVADPYLSLRARADSSGGARVTIEDLVIESDASRLTGAATIDTGLRVLLQAQVDLRDLQIAGAELHGLLRGPVIVTAPTLDSLTAANVTAQLDAAGVGVTAIDASVSGSMQFGGSLADPVVNAVLRGNGALSGGLRLDAAPGRGRLHVRSDLAFEGLDTDFDLTIDGGVAQARGQLRFGEAVLVLSDDAGVASLTGAGRLDGWTVTVAADFAGATVHGPLDRLVPGSSGTVDVAVGATRGATTPPDGEPSAYEPWLRGTVSDLVVGGQSLGDLSLASEAPDQSVTLTGETIDASFSPSTSAWSIELEGQALPGDLVVDLAGTGSGMAGVLTGAVRSTGSLQLDAALAVSVADEVSLSIDGQALGGALAVTGRRAILASGTWTGDVSLLDAAYEGVEVQVTGTLFGTELIPQVLLTTSARVGGSGPDATAAVALDGLISVGPQGITVDQQVAAAPLSERLRVRGRLTAPTDLVVSDPDGSSWRLQSGGANLRATGELSFDVGPASVALGARGTTAVPTVELSLASTPSLSASADLVGADLLEVIGIVASDGLAFEGEGAARGTIAVSLSPTPRAVLQGFGAEFGGFDIEAGGTVTADATELTGTVVLPAEVPAVAEQGDLSLPWRLVGSGTDWRLDSTGELGTVSADIDLDTLATRIEVDVALPGAPQGSGSVVERGITSGSVVGQLTYDPAAGAKGSFAIADVVLAPAAIGTVNVNADVAVAGGLVSGAASIDTSGGRVTLTGNAAIAELLPGLDLAGITPASGPASAPAPGPATASASGSNLELRVRTLDLGLIPGIAATVPHVNGALSGVVQLRNGVVLGQLVAPELSVGERLLPASLQLSGAPSSLDAALVVAGTLISGELDAGRLTGSARLERFPLELVAEAFVGPSDVTASLTGVLRFDVPLDDAASGFVRVATEEVHLERAGIVTLGNLTLTYDDGALNVERVEFGGRGAWEASGVLSPELLDFRLEAQDADFSPLLGLFPDLALYAVGAAGSFTFTASGSFAAPQMSLESDALDIGFAGTRYRIEGTSATLDGVDLTAETTVRGLDPLVGALDFSGSATVMLEPLALRFVDFRFEGSLSVPGFGVVEGISGVISQDQQNNPLINLSGMLGAPINVSGTLVPLDIRAGGTGLDLSLPALLIGDASLDLDLRLRGEEGGLSLGGAVVAEEIILDLAARAPEPETEPSADGLEAEAESVSALASSEEVAATEAQGARNALAALRFDDLRITAPQRVVLAMNIANIEAALDLTVSGTAADPRLDGTAEALRGSLRFSGREFTFDSGVATFSASRGVFPELAIVATTEFEKSRVLTGSQGVRFVSPSEGQTFTVGLSITGPVEAAPPEEGGFRFDVRPVLTSEALIEVEGEGVGTGVRPLTEPELLSLITLGRVDFEAGIIGAGGLGGAVAQGALDTAVDLLIVGELQSALREALGLDVVEIRTSAISSLLGGDAEQFGVSVRLGGYLNPELFASYRIGTADPGDPAFALTNEVALSYALGPLDLDLVGRIDFPTAGTLANPRPELGVGLRYDFGRTLGLDAGVTLSTQRSVVSFGVALRW